MSINTGATARQTTSLLKTAESTPTAAMISASKRGRDRKLGEPGGDVSVEAPEPELRRHHHQPEEQREGRDVERTAGLGEGGLAAGEQRDGAEQGDAGAIEREAREAPEQHAEVDRSEDGGGEAQRRRLPPCRG